jgi:hypothetical protein
MIFNSFIFQQFVSTALFLDVFRTFFFKFRPFFVRFYSCEIHVFLLFFLMSEAPLRHTFFPTNIMFIFPSQQ